MSTPLKLAIAIVLALPVLSACSAHQPVSPSRRPVARDYPSIFQAWSPIENRPGEDDITRLARHDLVFSSAEGLLGIEWQPAESQRYSGLATHLNTSQLSTASAKRERLLAQNPNVLLLVELRYHDAIYVAAANEGLDWHQNGYYPPDSPYWLRDGQGQPVVAWGEDTNGDGKVDEKDTRIGYLIDFTNEQVQDLVADQALALRESGLFNGIMLDWWNEYQATAKGILSSDAELKARLAILTKTREKVGDIS